jgi:hypothetical protein
MHRSWLIRRCASGALASIALTAACTRPAPPAQADAPRDSSSAARVAAGPVQLTRLRSERFAYTFNSGIRERTQRVLSDSASWVAIWTQLNERRGSPPPPPSFDPTREQFVRVALGERGPGGYNILLDSATVVRDSVLIYVTTSAPGPRCGTTGALTQPVDVARMPRLALPTRFVERAAITDCP